MRVRMFLPLLAFAVGCSSAPPAPDFTEAKGRVTVGGKAVSKAYVGFIPTGPQQEVYAKIENGEFTARLMPGKYQVVVEPEWKRTAMAAKASDVPARYMDVKTSKLEAEVPKEGKTNLDFRLN